MAKVTLELTATAGERRSGWGEDAVVDFKLEHPDLKGALILQCRRKDLEGRLKELGETKGSFDGATNLDIMNELVYQNLGVTLTDKEKKALSATSKPRQRRRTVID